MFVKKKHQNKYVKDKKRCTAKDHCHYTGEYRVAVYSICNLNNGVPKKVSLVFIMELTMNIILS